MLHLQIVDLYVRARDALHLLAVGTRAKHAKLMHMMPCTFGEGKAQLRFVSARHQLYVLYVQSSHLTPSVTPSPKVWHVKAKLCKPYGLTCHTFGEGKKVRAYARDALVPSSSCRRHEGKKLMRLLYKSKI